MSIIKDWNSTTPETGFTRANGQFCCSYSITTVAKPDGTSGNVLRFELNSTDALVSSSRRAELQLTNDKQTGLMWYGIKYWFEKYDSDSGAESIMQWHDSDGTTPPLSIQVQGGRLRIMQSFTSGNIPYDIGPLVTGVWTTILIGVKWAEDTSGSLEVWRDNKQLINKSGIRSNSKGGSYFKYGINKWSWAPGGGGSTTTKRVFYTDQFRIGTTMEDVTPGGVIVVPNLSPVVNAGADQTIKLPNTHILLDGKASDTDGSIASVSWSQISGPTSLIANSSIASTTATLSSAGVYTFSLKAVDDKGSSSVDSLNITVSEADPAPARVATNVSITYNDGTQQTL